ncbi:hypothetical protein [Paenibacillus guangzhouensis]|uniref:hypothetical protein n=1 Tax=Paenibacillus guangzhouensis TaxID=1473112 RepID=UPI001266A65C|nr:hypothetical protein [Paenibacillus guangzhouensis]
MRIEVTVFSEEVIGRGGDAADAADAADAVHLSRLIGLLPEGSHWSHWQDTNLKDQTPGEETEQKQVAIVTDPMLFQQVRRMKPDHIIAMLSPCPSGVQQEEWSLMRQLLCAYADMVCSASERIYLEECFRRDGVFYLHRSTMMSYGMGKDMNGEVIYLRDDELIWKQAVELMLDGGEYMPLMAQQWQCRQAWYEAMQRKSSPHELIHFMQASYAYLLHEDDAAKAWIQKACDVAGIRTATEQISPYYHFLAAIAARRGHVAEALHYYEAMAHLPQERGHYEQLAAFYAQGEMTLLRAQVLRLNEDHKYVTDLIRGSR